jgi:hypothetical protein
MEFARMMGFAEVPDWGNSTEWQYWVIDVVKRYEQEKGYHLHPIGMTMQFPVKEQMKVNDPLFNSKAEWISPGYDDEIFAEGLVPMAPGAPQSHWYENPRPNDGRKVIITDTDHYAPGKGDALWAWKSFLRGHHPILMDFGIIAGVHPPEAAAENSGEPGYADFEAARYAMGDTLHYAEKMDLISMVPRQELSSTGFVLANPGEEYLILQPDKSADPFTVKLEPGTYAVEWFGLDQRETKMDGKVSIDSASDAKFIAPFEASGPSVLYLKRVS